MNKPRLYWNSKAKYWVCSGSYVLAMGSSPRVAYAVWNQRQAELKMFALLETL